MRSALVTAAAAVVISTASRADAFTTNVHGNVKVLTNIAQFQSITGTEDFEGGPANTSINAPMKHGDFMTRIA